MFILANGDALVTSGTTQGKIEVDQKTYQDILLLMLFWNLTFSDNITLSDWSQDVINPICAGLNELVFPVTKTAFPSLLFSSVYSAKPIATKWSMCGCKSGLAFS